MKRLSQKIMDTTPAPWVRRSTKLSIPPNPKSHNPYSVLNVQPTSDEIVEKISDEETQSDVPNPTPSVEMSEEESAHNESEQQSEVDHTPVVDKKTCQLITVSAPRRGRTIPNAPFPSSESNNTS